MKKLLLVVFMFLVGCQKEDEEPKFKTASNVKVHEIITSSPDSSDVVYWYIFHKGGKFIYTKSQFQLSDFSSTFFSSSESIPKELKFSEEFVRTTSADSNDLWGFEIVEIQKDSVKDSLEVVDSLFVPVDSVKVDSVSDSLVENYEIGEKQ